MILLPFIFISPTIKPPDTKPPDTKPPDTKPQDCAEASALGGGLAAGFIIMAYCLLYQLDHSLQWVALELFGSDKPIKIALGLITFLNIFHYYTETFAWGKDSPYRQHVGFSQ